MMEKHKCFDCFREGKSYSGVYVPKWVCTLVQVRVSGTFVPVIGWNTAVVLINQWYKPRFTFLIIVPVFEGTRDLSEKSIVRRERRLTKDLLIINTLAPAPKHLNLFLGLEIVNRTNIIILFGWDMRCEFIKVSGWKRRCPYHWCPCFVKYITYRFRCTRQHRIMYSTMFKEFTPAICLSAGRRLWMAINASPHPSIWGWLPSTRIVDSPCPWRNFTRTGRPMTRSTTSKKYVHTAEFPCHVNSGHGYT